MTLFFRQTFWICFKLVLILKAFDNIVEIIYQKLLYNIFNLDYTFMNNSLNAVNFFKFYSKLNIKYLCNESTASKIMWKTKFVQKSLFLAKNVFFKTYFFKNFRYLHKIENYTYTKNNTFYLQKYKHVKRNQ